MPVATEVNTGSSNGQAAGSRVTLARTHGLHMTGQKKAPLMRGLESCLRGRGRQREERQRASRVNLLKATPKSQPSPLPASASDTLPLVMA